MLFQWNGYHLIQQQVCLNFVRLLICSVSTLIVFCVARALVDEHASSSRNIRRRKVDDDMRPVWIFYSGNRHFGFAQQYKWHMLAVAVVGLPVDIYPLPKINYSHDWGCLDLYDKVAKENPDMVLKLNCFDLLVLIDRLSNFHLECWSTSLRQVHRQLRSKVL